MKNKILFATVVLFLFIACNKQLNTKPTDSASETDVVSSVTGLNTIFEGTWADMMDGYYGGVYSNPGFKTIGAVSDAMGDDVNLITTKYGFNNAYPFLEMYDNTRSRVSGFWAEFYKIINSANIILANVDKASGEDGDKDILKGQAYGLRATMYLNLASFYQFSYLKDSLAKTVPIYTDPATDTTAGKPKATLKAIYTLIFSDLQQAKTLLKDYERPAKYRFDVSVINGLLARASLNTGHWADAAVYAHAARQNYPLMTKAQYTTGFNDISNPEWIWGHPESATQSGGSYIFEFLDVSSDASYYYSFMADPNFMSLFDNNDYRKSLFEWSGQSGRTGYLQYKKFLLRPDNTADLVLMRSSEEYLIEAEAYGRLNNLSKAIGIVNELRAARNADLYPQAGASQSGLIDAILIERRKELWGEGFSLSDIIRNQLPVVRKPYLDAKGNPVKVTVSTPSGSQVVTAKYHTTLKFPDGTDFVPNSKYYLFAIPQSEVQSNPNLGE